MFEKEPLVELKSSQIKGYELLYRDLPEIVSREEYFAKLSEEEDLAIFFKALSFIEREELNSDRFFINIKPRTVVRYAKEIIKELTKRNLLSRVVLELREDADIKDLREIKHIREDLPVPLCLDDFGVKGSNVDRLIILKPDIVKLDISILKHIDKRSFLLLVEFLHSLKARNFFMEIVAEKIETEHDLSLVKAVGLKYGQGWMLKNLKPQRVVD